MGLFKRLYDLIPLYGYRVIKSSLGQLFFRHNPIGRALVRRFAPFANFLPLAAPQYVLIDICNICNFKCTFCPTGDIDLLKSVGRGTGMMGLDLFKKIIDDLKAFNGKITIITLHKDGEPLLNPNIGAMIAYAKQAKVAGNIEVTSNASMLTPKVADTLIDAGLDAIRVSVEHVSDEGYKGLTLTYGNYERIRGNVKYLHTQRKRKGSKLRILSKIIDTGLSEEEKTKFLRDFRPISDTARIEAIMGWGNSMGKDFKLGLDPKTGMDGVTKIKPQRLVCPEPFRYIAVNYNGIISPCCNDWSIGLKMGDVKTTPIMEIWKGQEYARLRRTHLEGRRKEVPVCADCHFMLGVTDFFDLDDRREELLKKFQTP